MTHWSKLKIICCVSSIFLFASFPCRAVSLVDQGITTYDPNTGLTWLDVQFTTGFSYNQVTSTLITPGGLFAGYRYATGAEITTLFNDAGVTNPCFICSGDVTPTAQLVNLLSPTTTTLVGLEILAIQAEGSGGSHSVAILGWDINPTPFFAAQVAFTSRLDDVGTDLFGSFLVLDATPLPAALPLFASGLGALGLFGWRRKKKAAAA
jgi:hypothetical protein